MRTAAVRAVTRAAEDPRAAEDQKAAEVDRRPLAAAARPVASLVVAVSRVGPGVPAAAAGR